MPMSAQPPGRPPAPVAPSGFELLAPLGVGASSVVWSATCLALGDTVALKWAAAEDDSAAVRLSAEAEVLARVDHPNVVRLFDVLTGPDGRSVLVLEHARGGSLADVLARRGSLPAREVAQVGVGVARGLEALHRVGLVHRDVKPSNILLGDGGRPLLADFGAAVDVDGAVAPADITGTPAYLDPAVLAGGAPDARADVYGLGVTLHEALTGNLPGEGDLPPVLPSAAVTGATGRLRAAILRAASSDPTQRHGRAADLGDELELLAATAGEEPHRLAHAPVPLASATAPPRTGGDRGTRTFGPRPPRRPPPDVSAPRPGPVLAAGAGVATAALLLSPVSPLIAGAGTTQPTSCPPIEQGRGLVAADLDGDGCPAALTWDGRILQVPAPAGATVAYAIGRPGDTLLFGDWDCDGQESPALHRPRTGETILFPRLPEPGQPLTGEATAGPAGATATVAAGPDGCDTVDVEQ